MIFENVRSIYHKLSKNHIANARRASAQRHNKRMTFAATDTI